MNELHSMSSKFSKPILILHDLCQEWETKKDPLEMNCIIMSFIAYFITKVLPLIYGNILIKNVQRPLTVFI